MADIKSYYRKCSYQRQRTYDQSNTILSYQKKFIAGFISCSKKNILDVGCGNSPIGSLFAETNKVIGIDLSDSALQKATQNGVCCVAANVEKRFPFKDKAFDFVLLTEVIEHVFDPVSLLKEACRVLRGGGMLICSMPNTSFILNRLFFLFTGLINDCTAQERMIGENAYISEHIRIIPPKLLKKILYAAGFSLLKIDYWFPDYFVKKPFSRLNFVARIIKKLKLQAVFPNLICLNLCAIAFKKRMQ